MTARPPVHLPRRCRPDHAEHGLLARWLVHESLWGVVSTTSAHLGGVAFGNVLSLSDGPPCEPTGRLLFYLTAMDATAQDLQQRGGGSNASLTLSEAALVQRPGEARPCAGVDAEDPTCAKLTLSGALGWACLPAEQLVRDRGRYGHCFLRIYRPSVEYTACRQLGGSPL